MTPPAPDRSVHALTIYLSHVRLEVSTDLPEVARGLRAVWRSAARPVVPTSRSEAMCTRSSHMGVEILLNDRLVATTRQPADVLPLLETALYQALREWHAQAGLTLLHAACVTRDDRAWIFMGPSGAGKSTLARAAVERGYSYATDELTVSDGRQVWGIERAIQFDVVPVDATLPAWLAQVDVSSYPLRAFRHGGTLPLESVPPPQLLNEPAPVAHARCVVIARADSCKLTRLDPLHTLQALHEASLGCSLGAVSALTAAHSAWALAWNDPAAALDLLEAQAD